MKKWLLALLLIPNFCFGKGSEKIFPMTDFHCGVDTYHSPLSIDSCFVQDAINVFFDKSGSAEKRAGYTVVFTSNTSPSYSGAWNYTDPTSTSWIIVRSPAAIIANNLNGTQVVIATVSISNSVNEVNAFGSAYFVDQTQGVYYWNGSTTTYVSGSPKGSLIEQFHGRIWVAGQAIPNGNILNGSGYLSGSTWATGVNATDPVQFTIGLNDNYDTLTALYGSVNDTLYLFKNFSTSALYGFDLTDFQVRQLNREDGCVDSRSIQAFNKGLVLMGSKGIEFFDGYSFTRISDPIKNKVDGAIQTSFNSQSWVQSSQSDFQQGLSSPTNNLSTSISPGDVVVSSFSAGDSVASDFSSGTFNNTKVSGNSVILSTNSAEILDNSFETFSGYWDNSRPGWTQNGTVTGDSCNVSPKDASFLALFTNGSVSGFPSGYTITAALVDALNGSYYGSTSFSNVNTCLWTQNTISVSPSASGHLVFVAFYSSLGSDLLKSNSFISNGNSITFYSSGNQFHHIGVPNIYNLYTEIDLVQGSPRSTITMGSFTSRPFDVVYTSNGYVYPTSNWTVNTSTPTFVLQQGDTSSGPWSDLIVGTGTSTNFSKEFLRYISTFTISGNDSALSSLNSVNILVRSTGTYYSQVHNVSSINSWGNFNVDDSANGGSLSYFVRSSTSPFSTLSSTPSWVAQSKNTPVATSTGTYFQMSSTFTITSATQTPTMNDFSFNWYSGNKLPPMASTVFDNRYWLSLTTNTADSYNDGTLVLNTKGVWSIFSLTSGGFAQSKGFLYHADASPTGNVYQDNYGYSDNGSPIDSYIKTKDYPIDSWINDDFFTDLWIAADNNGASTINTSYTVDGATNTYSLSPALTNELQGRLYLKLPVGIDSTHQNFSKTISFKWENNDNNAAMRLFGGYLLYKERPTQ